MVIRLAAAATAECGAAAAEYGRTQQILHMSSRMDNSHMVTLAVIENACPSGVVFAARYYNRLFAQRHPDGRIVAVHLAWQKFQVAVPDLKP